MRIKKKKSILSKVLPFMITFIIAITAIISASIKKGSELTITFTGEVINNNKLMISKVSETLDIEEKSILSNIDDDDLMVANIIDEDVSSEEETILDETLLEEEEYIVHPASFNIYNLLEPSNLSVEELEHIFGSLDYAYNMIPLASIFIEAEETFGVNALILSAIASLESDYARSERAIYDYNIFGWGVFTDDSIGVNSTSYYEGIMKTAESLKFDYLTPDGPYFNGYSLEAVNIRYSLNENGEPNTLWSQEISSIASTFLNVLE